MNDSRNNPNLFPHPPLPKDGEYPTAPLFTVLREYRDYVMATSEKQTTRGRIRRTVDHLRGVMKNVTVGGEPAELLDEVQTYVVNRRRVGWMTSTININLRVLRSAVIRFQTRYLGALVPKIKLLPEVRKRVEILRDNEVEQLLEASGPKGRSMTRAVLAIAAYAGLRDAEIHHLKMEDVMLLGDLPMLLVTEKPEVGWTPKTYQERGVGVCRKLREELEPYFQWQGLEPGLDMWAFPVGKPEKRKRRRSSGDEVKAAYVRAGLYDRSRRPGLHQLRRTFASVLLGRGADIETVRDLLGHADLQTTAKYLGTTDKRRTAAVELLDDD